MNLCYHGFVKVNPSKGKMLMSPQEPRAGGVVVAETPWLARMTDKARLDAEGTIKTFDLKFPCPMDQQCLSRIGLDAKTFQALAVEHPSDDTLIPALREAGAKLG
jgi:hypothetical protein